ncbi:MAG: sirohydrochlorin cobaltochelatase [Propionibacteriaceae bacterium]|nr:sirohydrochlorin cobaltochelatase [Propionibacteriaceae bacterium]
MKRQLTRLVAPAIGAALLCLATLSGCSTAAPPSASDTPSQSVESGPKAILAVSFGTSYDDNRELSIGGIEGALQAANPGYQVRRAFTAQTIIDILAGRGIQTDNVTQAMDRLVADGIKEVVIQPTTIMAGFEYNDLVSEASAYKDKFDSFSISSPLLMTDADFQAVAQAITARTAQYATDGTAVVFMGHGTHAPSNADYAKMQTTLTDAGFKNYLVGTVEASPSVEDVIKAAQKIKAKKAVLLPLMVVAGDHANNDMAGDEPDSWKSQFEKAGFEVECILEGLGQYPDIQQLYVQHAKSAIDQATATGANSGNTGSDAEISASQLKEGDYSIDATTDSSMFKIVNAQLNVAGSMTATLTLSGDGFGRLFLGTADQAAKASDGFIEFTSDDQGRHVYTMPVDALNKTVSLAAESGKTADKWYDHTITLSSARIPADAITA